MRERSEDIPLLTKHFLAKSARELNVETKRLSEPALKYLATLDFPGNVRQLENLCHWITVMAPGQQVDISDLPPEFRDAPASTSGEHWESALAGEADRLLNTAPGEVFSQLSMRFERTLIERALAHTGGRRVEASVLLGIGRNTLTRKLQELGMEKASAKEE